MFVVLCMYCIYCTIYSTVYFIYHTQHRYVRLRPVRQGLKRGAVSLRGGAHAARHLRQAGVQNQLPGQDVSIVLYSMQYSMYLIHVTVVQYYYYDLV